MMTTSRHGSRQDWEDNSQGIRHAPHAHHRRVGRSHEIAPISAPLASREPPPADPWAPTRIPRAPQQDVGDLETAELRPRPPMYSDMQLPRFIVNENTYLQQMKLYIDEIERINQRLCRPYPIGTQAGIYTDSIQSKELHFITEAAQNLSKAVNFKRAYIEQHDHDDDPEGA